MYEEFEEYGIEFGEFDPDDLEATAELPDLYDQKRAFPEPRLEDEDTVTIAARHFYALKNAYRISRDRQLQQLDKAKQDKHGYQLVKCVKDEKYMNHRELWRITKNTPHSLRMTLQDATEIIIFDLEMWYSYLSEERLRKEKASLYEVVDFCRKYERAVQDDKLEAFKSNHGRLMEHEIRSKELAIKYAGKISFDVVEITPNYSRGTYQVTYYANTPL